MEKQTKNTVKNQELVEQGIPEIPTPSIQEYTNIVVDPFGSWTGVPVDDPLDTPVQDVDDL